MEEKMIYKKMIEVIKRITKVGKTQKNAQQGFMFRGIDDVQNALHDIFGDVGVVCVPVDVQVTQADRVSSKGTPMIHSRAQIKYRFYAEDGSYIDAAMEGEAIDSGDKSTSKAISIAYKYLLLETFMIPTEEVKDPDHESHELAKVPQKPYLKQGDVNWNKAVDYIVDNGKDGWAYTMSKFNITEEEMQKLESDVLLNTPKTK